MSLRLSDSEKLFLRNLRKSKIKQKKEYEYVDLFTRLGAFIIDLVLIAIILIPFFIINDYLSKEITNEGEKWYYNYSKKMNEPFINNNNHRQLMNKMNKVNSYFINEMSDLHQIYTKYTLNCISIIIITPIFFIMFWIYQSTTPGKKIFSTQILDEKTLNKPTKIQYLGRYLSYFISLIPFGLGFIWITFDLKNQAWHDKLSSTIVVKVKKNYIKNYEINEQANKDIDNIDNILNDFKSPDDKQKFKDNPDLKYAPPGFEIESKQKIEKKKKNKEILFLNEEIKAKQKKIYELDVHINQHKYKIKNLKAEIKENQEQFIKEKLLLFSEAAKLIISELKLNQETVNKIIKLSKKFNIEKEYAVKLIKRLINKN